MIIIIFIMEKTVQKNRMVWSYERLGGFME
jgi:hypothetical protein